MASNNPLIPHVSGGTLYRHDGSEICPVGSPAWYAWLDDPDNRSFAFVAASGDHLTAVKESRKSSSGKVHFYWYAYRSIRGEKRRLTLGKSERLDLGRLERAAAELARVEAVMSSNLLGRLAQGVKTWILF